MTVSCDVYKGCNKLGSGTATDGSATITSFTTAGENVVGPGRNVQVTFTTGSHQVGTTVNQRVLTDSLTSLVLDSVLKAS
jgi:hypothetical protein